MTKIVNVLITRFFVIIYIFDFLIIGTRNDVPYNYYSEKNDNLKCTTKNHNILKYTK